MCQLFIGFGGGTLVICQQITIMAASEHKHIPSLLAMENMFIKIGSAVGSTIAGALWMDEFPKMLAQYLPESAQPDLQKIYGSLTIQSSYAYGSPERNGIIEAYSAAQRYMLVAATCLCLVSWSAVLMWKDIDTKNLKKKDKNQIF
jgi:hypothetical protein